MSLDFVAYEDTPPTGTLRQIANAARERRLQFYGRMRRNWYVPPPPPEPEPVIESGLEPSAAVVPLEAPVVLGPQPFNNVTAVQRVVARHYGCSRDEMLDYCKIPILVTPRQVAAYFVHQFCPQLSIGGIGRQFRRDRATIRHALRKVGQRARRDPVFAADLAEIEVQLTQVFASL